MERQWEACGSIIYKRNREKEKGRAKQEKIAQDTQKMEKAPTPPPKRRRSLLLWVPGRQVKEQVAVGSESRGSSPSRFALSSTFLEVPRVSPFSGCVVRWGNLRSSN